MSADPREPLANEPHPREPLANENRTHENRSPMRTAQ